jgi:hypothetical protein
LSWRRNTAFAGPFFTNSSLLFSLCPDIWNSPTIDRFTVNGNCSNWVFLFLKSTIISRVFGAFNWRLLLSLHDTSLFTSRRY